MVSARLEFFITYCISDSECAVSHQSCPVNQRKGVQRKSSNKWCKKVKRLHEEVCKKIFGKLFFWTKKYLYSLPVSEQFCIQSRSLCSLLCNIKDFIFSWIRFHFCCNSIITVRATITEDSSMNCWLDRSNKCEKQQMWDFKQ